MSSLNGKIAVITGVNSGIARAAAEMFAAEGVKIAGMDVRTDRMQELTDYAQSVGSEFIGFGCDVRDGEAVHKILESAHEHFGRIDIVLNIAGISCERPVTHISDEEYQRVMDINVKGVFNLCKYAVPYMKKQHGGVIINTSSVTGIFGTGIGSPYAASKAAIIGLTKSLAMELAPWHIRVNSVAPGVVDTEMVSGLDERAKRTFAKAIPLGRMAKPRDVAAAMRFLASDEAEYITGAVLNVDGGYRPAAQHP